MYKMHSYLLINERPEMMFSHQQSEKLNCHQCKKHRL